MGITNRRKIILSAITILVTTAGVWFYRSRQSKLTTHHLSLDTRGKSPLVENIKIIQQNGVRPRFSPDGKTIVFDRKTQDEFYDVYLSDLDGKITASLTAGNPAVNQRNNGNAIFHPSGDYIVFISETEEHAFKFAKWAGDPGLGTFSNLWITTTDGKQFWQLTDIPIKKNIFDQTPSYAIVNPHFSHDGRKLVWTERYQDKGGHLPKNQWGKWQIKISDFIIENNVPKLKNERLLLRAEDICSECNYVTAMSFLPEDKQILLAGNLDGQHEFGMDQYVFNLKTKELTNLQNTPEYWEEDASLSPDGKKIVYMTNIIAQDKLDFTNPNWPSQKREREYFLMNVEGNDQERLTYFNDPTSPEYIGRNAIVAASDISPDGKYLAGTLGVDFGDKNKVQIELKIVLLELGE